MRQKKASLSRSTLSWRPWRIFVQEVKEQGRLGEVSAIEASLLAAEQKLAAMHDLEARHTTVHSARPTFTGLLLASPPSIEVRMRSSSPEHYNEEVDPEPWGPPYAVQDDQENPKPAQSRGPVVCRDEDFVISAGVRGAVLVHPEDAPDLQHLPN
ncbi:hypothetical protein ABZS86_35545 [Streptomyces sp. NPDC005355]|uniref:hypothetical protein n=1 Tax=Streptomyces sp. NPDC005355 TaxID=3157038 RepID=UPI0033B23F1F